MIELLSLATMTLLGTATDLPDRQELLSYRPPSNVYIQNQDGDDLLTLGVQNRDRIDFDDIPKVVIDAVLSAEDKNFWLHSGFDPHAIGRAMVQNAGKSVAGKRLVGGSTVSQQISKLAFVGSQRSLKRKVREIMVARRFEGVAGKPHVLELYLNEIYFGRGAYGIAKASEVWFGKQADALNAPQAATLAAMIKAPGTFSREKNFDRLRARRNAVLKEMAENGYLTAAAAASAQKTPLVFVPPKRRNRSIGTYYEDTVRRDLVDLLGEKRVRQGGLRVTVQKNRVLQMQVERSLSKALMAIDSIYPFRGTRVRQKEDPLRVKNFKLATVRQVTGKTVDWTLPDGSACTMSPYKFGNHRVKGNLKALFRQGEVAYVLPDGAGGCLLRQLPQVSGAVVALNARTGAVIATAGGYDYSVSKFNRAVQAYRQPGSTIKPMIYAAAFSNGLHPNSMIRDEPLGLKLTDGRVWIPSNADRKFIGPMRVEAGLYRSRNVATVRLAQKVGFDKIWRFARHVGLSGTMPREWTIALGSAETTVTKMAGAYVSLLGGGRVRIPTTIKKVTDLKGNVLVDPAEFLCSGCVKSSVFSTRMNGVADANIQISKRASVQLKNSLRKVMTQGTGRSVGKGMPNDVIGKTGTTGFYRDAWFVGQTTALGKVLGGGVLGDGVLGEDDPVLIAVYIGYDSPKPIARGATGGRIAGPVFKDIVLGVLNRETEKPKTQPPVVPARAVKKPIVHFAKAAVNMRKEKSTASRIFQTIPQNKLISQVSCGNFWCQGTYDGETGYVEKRYIGISSIDPSSGRAVTRTPDRFTGLRKFMRASGGTYRPDYKGSTSLVSARKYRQLQASRAQKEAEALEETVKAKQLQEQDEAPGGLMALFGQKRENGTRARQLRAQQKRSAKKNSRRRCKMKNFDGVMRQVCITF